VAVSMTDIASQNTDIWTYDLQRGGAKRLTFDPAADSVRSGVQMLHDWSLLLTGHRLTIYI